jgi:hypothetical protein
MLDSAIDLDRHQAKMLKEVQDEFVSTQVRAGTSAVRLGKQGYKKLFLTPYRKTQSGSFKLAGLFEHHLKSAALGKAALKEAERLGIKTFPDELSRLARGWGDAVEMQPDVITELAKGLTDSNVLTKYGKHVNRVMGDYTTMSPELRALIVTVAPFGLWLRAATKWTLGLPANSPVRTAMVAATNRLNEKERLALGLSPLALEGGLDDYLEGSLTSLSGELKEGQEDIRRTNAYTSLGPLQDFSALTQFAIPQIDMIKDSIEGKDWLGDDIYKKNGEKLGVSERLGVLSQQILEAYVMPLGLAHKFAAHGTPDASYSFLYNIMNGKSPLAGIERRKYYPNKYNEEEPPTESHADSNSALNSLGDIFIPFRPEDNPFVKRQNELKEDKEIEEGVIDPGDADAESEWLYGVKTKKTRKEKKKTVKSAKSVEEEWLYGK